MEIVQRLGHGLQASVPGAIRDALVVEPSNSLPPQRLPPAERPSGFRQPPTGTKLASEAGVMDGVQKAVAEPRVGLLHVESRLLLQEDGNVPRIQAVDVAQGLVPLGGLLPEEAMVANSRELDTSNRRWKLEVHASYPDEYPFRLVIRNDFGSQMCLRRAPQTRRLVLANTASPQPCDLWEIEYAPGLPTPLQGEDRLLFALRSAARDGTVLYLGVEPNRPLLAPGPAVDAAASEGAAPAIPLAASSSVPQSSVPASSVPLSGAGGEAPRLVLTAERQMWAMVDFTSRPSGLVAVGMKTFAIAGVEALTTGLMEFGAEGAASGTTVAMDHAGSGAGEAAVAARAAADGGVAGSAAAAETGEAAAGGLGAAADGADVGVAEGPEGTEGVADAETGSSGVFGTFGAGLSALGSLLRWIVTLAVVVALAQLLGRCLRGTYRCLARHCDLFRPDRVLSINARWHFQYVRALCADPRDVRKYVWVRRERPPSPPLSPTPSLTCPHAPLTSARHALHPDTRPRARRPPAKHTGRATADTDVATHTHFADEPTARSTLSRARPATAGLWEPAHQVAHQAIHSQPKRSAATGQHLRTECSTRATTSRRGRTRPDRYGLRGMWAMWTGIG